MSSLSKRALERRLKRYLLKATHRFFTPCAPGFEDVLETEIKALSSTSLEGSERGGVNFSGPLDTVYHANLRLRTAHRVLLRLDDFLAPSYPILFNRISRLPWELYLGFNKTYTLKVSAKTSRIRHHKNIIKTVHAGVLKALKTHRLSPVLNDDAALEFHIRLFQDRCTVSLNTSGKHLHKRGYRTYVSIAPMRETLAASTALSCDAQDYDTIVDPMCGSGTLLIEAALLAKHIAPGSNRTFAFEAMPSFQQSKWERFKLEATKEQSSTSRQFLGNDIDPVAISAAQDNATRAEVAALIEFQSGSAESLKVSLQGRSLLLSNVPYGERLGIKDEVKTQLRRFASHLVQNYAGWDYGFITQNGAWLEQAGLDPYQKRPFYNGGLNVFLIRGHIPD